MNSEQAKALREPFPPEHLGKLPKPTHRDNAKGNCAECGKYHGLPAVHLDYASHATVTDRLLKVDPEWTWEPMAKGPNGEPLTVDGGLWIYLTVCGVTRPGFGDATGGKGPKEMIGDALRNAAMRFGVGLDLWAKEDLHATPEVDPFEALERELLALVPDVAESVADHRERSSREGHKVWLERCISAAQEKAKVRATGAPLPDSAGNTAPTAVEADTPPVSQAGRSPEPGATPATDGPGGAATGGQANPGPSPFAPPLGALGGPLDPRNSPLVLFEDKRSTQARTLKKLDVTVSKGREEGLFDVLAVHATAHAIAPDVVGEADEYADAEGAVRYSILRRVLPLWVASQMIDQLEAQADFARLAS